MRNYWRRWKVTRLLCLLILFGIFIGGCEKPKPQKVLHPPPVPEEKRLPVDYVLLIDNSGSIPRGESRNLARETIQTFIELAQAGDKISIILFDEGAEIITSGIIEDDPSRARLKKAVESELSFHGRYTDISKGVALLRKEQGSLFRGPDHAKPAIILISDGKLEPKGNVQEAYEQLDQDWHFLSGIAPFYTLGLGKTEINRDFLPSLTGFRLLNQMAETSRGWFYPVSSVEDLAGTCTKVLRLTKGYGELADQDIYLTDESTTLLAFLVMKRLPDHQLCRTADIRLIEPGGHTVDFYKAQSSVEGPNHIRWNNMEYFDLILVEHPTPGEWAINLESGEPPRVVALIRNTLHLRYLVQDEYWDHEKKIVMAWLYDEKTEKLSDRKCRIRTAFNVKEHFNPTQESKIVLQKGPKGAYTTALTLNGKEPLSGEYLLKIFAEDEKNFFLRQSPSIPIKVKDAYFSFRLPRGIIPKWPILWKGVSFNIDLDSKHPAYPSFQDPPKVSLYLTKIEEEKNISSPPVVITSKRYESGIQYRLQDKDIQRGQYVAYVVMEGRLTSGRRVSVESPESIFVLFFPIWVWICVGVIAFCGLIFLAFVFRPKLRGRLNFTRPLNKNPVVLSKHKKAERSFRGDQLRLGCKGKELIELKEHDFLIHAARGKRLKIKVNRGTLSLIRAGETKTIRFSELYRGDRLSFSENGTEYLIEVISPKRPPRRKR